MAAPSPPLMNGTQEKFDTTSTKPDHQEPADYVIVKATKEDFDDIHKFMLTDFLLTEPLNAALGVNKEEATGFFADIINCCFEDQVSYLVRQRADYKLVAIRLSCILDRASPEEKQAFGADYPSPRIQIIKSLLHELESQTWSLVPSGVNRLLSWFVISVDGSFKRRGIARQLIEHKLEEARQLGCQGIVAEASAFNSQQLFHKCGYTRLLEIMHSEWKDPATGRSIQCKDNTDRVTMEFKAL